MGPKSHLNEFLSIDNTLSKLEVAYIDAFRGSSFIKASSPK